MTDDCSYANFALRDICRKSSPDPGIGEGVLRDVWYRSLFEGVSCDEIGGLLYSTSTNPWDTSVYTGASGVYTVINGKSFSDSEGRTLVLHESNGAPATCDTISKFFSFQIYLFDRFHPIHHEFSPQPMNQTKTSQKQKTSLCSILYQI